jgi:hypothetical protein
MTRADADTVLGHIRKLCAPPADAADGDLLER